MLFCAVLPRLCALVHQHGQNQRQDNKDETEPLGRLGELGVERLGFALGKERFRTASNGAGQTGALTGLHQHDHGHGQTGQQLDNRQNQLQSSHGIHPFMIGEIIYYNGVTISQHLVDCKRCFAKDNVFLDRNAITIRMFNKFLCSAA